MAVQGVRRAPVPRSAPGHGQVVMSRIDDVFDALARQDAINIVQIGANDGRINDPIFSFVQSFRDRTNILLIEPQPELIPFLAANYQQHPAAAIYRGAIAPSEVLRLYRVKPELWASFRAGHLNDVPAYRAPSGFASASLQHVENHASGNFAVDVPLGDCIEVIAVPARRLGAFAGEWPAVRQIDLLQIDTEGLDDVTIHACDIHTLRPRYINYEFCHLGAERQRRLVADLARWGYDVETWSASDCLASLRQPDASHGRWRRLVRWIGRRGAKRRGPATRLPSPPGP